jgi:quaternary ammonium compound-resistance protein SugE
MNAWLLIVAAAALEVVFALSLDATDGFTRIGPIAAVVVFGSLAVVVLSRALQTVPVSVGYAAFTSLGVAGVSAVGVANGREPIGTLRLAGLALVLSGVVVLRLSAPG